MAKQTARRYPFAYLVVFDNTADALRRADTNYKVRSVDPAIGTITLSSPVSFRTWGERLTVVVRSEQSGWTQVELVARLKFGAYDWGKRAHDIRTIFAAIDAVLPGGAPLDTGSMATSGAWYPDPLHRHDLRYWDGVAWSPHVSDDGVASTDPIV
jgi:Protein of unknown function (DUF2510)